MRMPADKLVRIGLVESLSGETARRVPKRTGRSHGQHRSTPLPEIRATLAFGRSRWGWWSGNMAVRQRRAPPDDRRGPSLCRSDPLE